MNITKNSILDKQSTVTINSADYDETYEYLVTRFTRERIDNRVDMLKKRIQKYLSVSSNENLCILNITLLEETVTDYFADIERLKSFQGIEKINKNKITAYMSYWLLRRKPIQIIQDECSHKKIYPNEEFVTSLIMKDCLNKDPKLFKGMNKVKDLSQFIFYYLKYRIATPQHLEMFLEGLTTGVEMGIEYHKYHPDL